MRVPLDAVRPGDLLVAVSPHLDDAVLSIGATLSHLAHGGVDVRVLTVFGGDPSQDREPGASNLRAGFGSTGHAARARRREDDAACACLGVQPVRLAFDDDEMSAREPAALRAALTPALRDAQVVLAPGSPLQHPDHLLVATTVAACVPPAAVLARYLEQPYATWQALSRSTRSARSTTLRSTTPRGAPDVARPDVTAGWSRSSACWRCQRRKLAAAGCYRSQLAVLRRWPRLRVAAHELLARGERVAWPTSGPAG